MIRRLSSLPPSSAGIAELPRGFPSLGLLGAVLFGIFVARLYGALRLHTVSRSWVPVMSLIGGILVISAAVTEIGLAYAVSEFSFADEGQLARFFVLWSWNSASVYATWFLANDGGWYGSRALWRLFPDWFRPLSWALFGLSVFILVVARAPGLGAAPAVLWLGIVARPADLPHRRPCALHTIRPFPGEPSGTTASHCPDGCGQDTGTRSSRESCRRTTMALVPRARTCRTPRHSTDTRG